jgi:hypothetical protein
MATFVAHRPAGSAKCSIDPDDRWAGSDISTSHNLLFTPKDTHTSGPIGAYPVDCNLWMPFKQDQKDSGSDSEPIRNESVLDVGSFISGSNPGNGRVWLLKPRTIAQKGISSPFSPVINSLGDRVGLVEVVIRLP